MELSEIWLWYCSERLGQPSRLPDPVALSPWDGLELFLTFHPMFLARIEAIAATPYLRRFDGEADEGLAQLARFDGFDAWDGMSAGAWRVLYERLAYAEVVALTNEAAGNPVIAHLPAGLDVQSRARALLLQFLLGGARSIDRRLLPRSPRGAAAPLPGSTSLRRH